MAETRKTPIASHPALLRLATSFAGAFDPKKGILQILCVFLAFGPLCIPILALDPTQPISQLYHTSWDARDGLTGSVHALAQRSKVERSQPNARFGPLSNTTE
jgi:hypothetical protein